LRNVFPSRFNSASIIGLAILCDYRLDAYNNINIKIAHADSQSVPSSLWLSDGHLIAFSVMYDIAVFVYNFVVNKWLAFNDTGGSGYICLYFDGCHFDVLEGIATGERPPIPRMVICQRFNIEIVNVWHIRHGFYHVWMWPFGVLLILLMIRSTTMIHTHDCIHMQVLSSLINHA